MMHSKLLVAMVGAASALVLAVSPAPAFAHHGHGHNLLRGELTPSHPTDDPINGVNPGGLPWIISHSKVRVRESGRMDVRIRGLQIPRNGGADNPIPFIDAVLYCGGAQVADSGPHPMTVPGGDARFRVHLMVPKKCESATVLISPSTAVGVAFIASVMATDDDD